jgi:hypothetical protein
MEIELKYEIYGVSDDLIEVECEGCCPHDGYEFNTTICKNPAHYVHLVFSDGSIIEVHYDVEGIWRMSVLHYGTAQISHVLGTDGNIDYSDQVTIEQEGLQLLSVYEIPAPSEIIKFLHDPCLKSSSVESI